MHIMVHDYELFDSSANTLLTPLLALVAKKTEATSHHLPTAATPTARPKKFLLYLKQVYVCGDPTGVVVV